MRGNVAVAVTVVCLVLAGCASTESLGATEPSASGPSPTRSSVASPSATSSTRHSRAALSPVANGSRPATTTPPACRAAALRIAEGRPYDRGGAPADAVVAGYTLTNKSSKPCSLSGWAGITMRGDATVYQCTPNGNDFGPRVLCPDEKGKVAPGDLRKAAVRLQRADAPVVVVRPGEHASFTVVWSGDGACWDRPLTGEFRIPGDGRPLTVKHPMLCVKPMTITPFVAA